MISQVLPQIVLIGLCMLVGGAAIAQHGNKREGTNDITGYLIV